MAEKAKKRKFDDALAELQKIGTALEGGDLALEEALATYERGVALVRELNQQLADAEAKVQVLTRNAAGGLRLKPIEREDDAES